MARKATGRARWYGVIACLIAACVLPVDPVEGPHALEGASDSPAPLSGMALPMPPDPCAVPWRFDALGHPIQIPADCVWLPWPENLPPESEAWGEEVVQPPASDLFVEGHEATTTPLSAADD